MTPAEIAARLTPAQKRALLWLPGDPTWARGNAGRMIHSLYSLSDRLLVVSASHGEWWTVTDLGAAVRALLVTMEKTAND